MKLLKVKAVSETGVGYFVWINPTHVLSIIQLPERARGSGVSAINVFDVDQATISSESAAALAQRLEELG